MAHLLGATAVITTASDSASDAPGARTSQPSKSSPALDMLLRNAGLLPVDWNRLPAGEADATPPEHRGPLVAAHWRELAPSPAILRVAVPRLVIGLGCRKNAPSDMVETATRKLLAAQRLEPLAVAALATVKEKLQEPALQALAERMGVPLHVDMAPTAVAPEDTAPAGIQDIMADASAQAESDVFEAVAAAEPAQADDLPLLEPDEILPPDASVQAEPSVNETAEMEAAEVEPAAADMPESAGQFAYEPAFRPQAAPVADSTDTATDGAASVAVSGAALEAVMIIEEGDKISADARLIASSDMQVNQSTLTGESNPIRKTHEAGREPESLWTFRPCR